MKIIKFEMSVLGGDSKFYSDTIAVMLGETDLNKNFEVSVDNQNKTVEVRFNHVNKAGWANPTNWSALNETSVKNGTALRAEFIRIKEEVEVL